MVMGHLFYCLADLLRLHALNHVGIVHISILELASKFNLQKAGRLHILLQLFERVTMLIVDKNICQHGFCMVKYLKCLDCLSSNLKTEANI